MVERFVPLSSQFKITLVSISKKAFKFKRIGFFSKLTDGALIIWFRKSYLCLTSSLQGSWNLSFSWPLSLTKVLSCCNEPQVCCSIKILENKHILKKQFFLLAQLAKLFAQNFLYHLHFKAVPPIASFSYQSRKLISNKPKKITKLAWMRSYTQLSSNLPQTRQG